MTNSLPRAFIDQAAGIIGDTEKGLSGSKIIELCNAYAFDYNTMITHSSYPPETPNKRTALAENLLAFKGQDQYSIIFDLCEFPQISNQKIVKSLKKRLIENYSKDFANKKNSDSSEEKFLEKDFSDINTHLAKYDLNTKTVLQQRIDEIRSCLQENLPLAAIFLIASTIEGLLYELAVNNSTNFCSSSKAPHMKGAVMPIPNWKLNSLIDVSYDLKYISPTTHKFGHEVQDIRNFIHPREQIKNKYNPDIRAAKISFQVLMSVIEDLNKKVI